MCPAKFNYWAKNRFLPLVDSAHVRSIIIALFSTVSEIYIEFYKILNEILANYFPLWGLLLVNPINCSTILFEESIYVIMMVNLSKWLISGVESTELCRILFSYTRKRWHHIRLVDTLYCIEDIQYDIYLISISIRKYYDHNIISNQ